MSTEMGFPICTFLSEELCLNLAATEFLRLFQLRNPSSRSTNTIGDKSSSGRLFRQQGDGTFQDITAIAAHVDTITIRWSSGRTETWNDLPINTEVIIRESSSAMLAIARNWDGPGTRPK